VRSNEGETLDDAPPPEPTGGAVVYAPHLIVLLECDRPCAGSALFSLEGVDRITIGRGHARSARRHRDGDVVTLEIRVPGKWLSSTHARIVRAGPAWVLEDAGSRNGTFVDGARIERAVLDPHRRFELGHTFFRIDPALAHPSDAPLDLELPSDEGCGLETVDGHFGARLDALRRLAGSDVTLLLLGDTGTGKEVLARWIHATSRRWGEFVAVNCGAIPVGLVEGQLFGHVRGSFSGALRDELGLVRAADGGTLFLDEIADLPEAAQVALLRVLQEREVLPVGATRPLKVNVRVLAATHKPLEELAASGDFRADLFARLAGFVTKLPPLRERRDDVGILIASLLRRLAGSRAPGVTLAREAGRMLLEHEWPNNVRELEQCLAAALTLARDGRIDPSHFPSSIAEARVPRPSETPPACDGLSERDRSLRLDLLSELARHRGNVSNVARAMGKERMQIHRWCRRFGIDPAVYRR
jgi:transcriptional regulator with AAA-type ATPase domain